MSKRTARSPWQILMLQSDSACDCLAPDGEGYHLTRVSGWPAFAHSLENGHWDMVMIPSRLNRALEASDLMARAPLRSFNGPVVVVAEMQEAGQVSRAMQQGAVDYLLMPFESYHLAQLVNRLAMMRCQKSDVVAQSDQSRQLFQLARRVAQTDASVLINGESGTGKEVLAQFIHQASPRASGPFIAINCAAIPETMLESILFGHAKGAFTGAANAVAGKLELANEGTLLLDEIGELPLAMQTKLLRVLQEREVERLGSHQKIKLNIRVLAATNCDLEQMVADGRFRSDLFYRLNVFPLQCAPLRERPEDIVPLAESLLGRHLPSCQNAMSFSSSACRALEAHGWPGNVRELENVIQRALVMSRGCVIREEDLMLPGFVPSLVTTTDVAEPVERSLQPLHEEGDESKPDLHKSRKLAEFNTIIQTLRRFDGHRSKTAEELGVSTRALRYKIQTMREHGWDIDQLLAGQPSDGAATVTYSS